jgi:hypothetical protein
MPRWGDRGLFSFGRLRPSGAKLLGKFTDSFQWRGRWTG